MRNTHESLGWLFHWLFDVRLQNLLLSIVISTIVAFIGIGSVIFILNKIIAIPNTLDQITLGISTFFLSRWMVKEYSITIPTNKGYTLLFLGEKINLILGEGKWWRAFGLFTIDLAESIDFEEKPHKTGVMEASSKDNQTLVGEGLVAYRVKDYYDQDPSGIHPAQRWTYMKADEVEDQLVAQFKKHFIVASGKFVNADECNSLIENVQTYIFTKLRESQENGQIPDCIVIEQCILTSYLNSEEVRKSAEELTKQDNINKGATAKMKNRMELARKLMAEYPSLSEASALDWVANVLGDVKRQTVDGSAGDFTKGSAID